jgi:hypothetical protein
MLRRHGNRRNKLQWVVDWNLGSLVQRVIIAALVNVVVANDVSDEDAVKNAAFERDPELCPVFEILVLPGPVAWMRP